MSNTIRITTTPDGSDKYLKVKLEQDFDFIEILSLKISQEDTYRKFCSDYGVIVGRVNVNNGFGVPNAKVSVFIPLDDIDKNDPVIKGLYPFEVVTDKDSDGVRYNLFPKDADPSNECSSPIGTFPTKREVLDNTTILDIYCKYYKFTTTTNHAGDFMIFGVPLGTYMVHIDADISDIGVISQRPYDLISQGTPSKMFYSPTKFNTDKNLDKLIQVKTLNAGVNVQPFWGDTDNCEIGITRLDFDLNHTVVPAAIFVGSIFGDQDKHSINYRCRPRKKLGQICEQVTGPGSIQMIRKTIDGQVEDFDVEGGRVIDDDGAWAYQIPMNLDYMVTSEDGSLILSQDPNKGVPTRARVRFNIGMDETGGEGRKRTRARYLVPNNPQNASEVDYNFGSNTLETSFRDLHWNKIYSVSNFISRFQRASNLLPVKSRSMTALKDVDACAGDKTPFPYNRVNTEVNPIFFVICLIIKIIAFLIYIMNIALIPLINVIIAAINSFMNAIVSVVCGIVSAINSVSSLLGLDLSCGLSWSNISYIGCVHVDCPSDNGSTFAPGCKNGGIDSGHAWVAANASTTLTYYCNDPAGHGCSPIDYAVGLDNCIAFEMANALNLFQFDFYNDWINGSLFGFLLKYKKKKKGREKFCEYDCDDIPNGGVDGNSNGVADNSCHNQLLLDTCFGNGNNCQTDSRDSGTIRDGLIKKVGDEFFYAATTHSTQFKLFATDLINLGSVFACDWQGMPKINDLLIPTTYKIPPDIQEVADDGTTEACGMVGIGGNTTGLFFKIDCLGIHVDQTQCLNLRHQSEIGVDIDQIQDDPFIASDCILGVNDIDNDRGKFFRDVFFELNKSTTPWIGLNSFPPIGTSDTNFNTSNLSVYDFTSRTQNGNEYIDFRYGSGTHSNNSYLQTKHSYFFYFGLLPGKTGLDKMNNRFFTHCTPGIKNDMLIQASSTVATGSTGTISFSFIGGTGPYTYTITGVIPTAYGPILGSTTGPVTVTGLAAGTYLITGFDSLGTPASQTVTVSGPPAFYCNVMVTKNATAAGVNDGEITITSVGGGSGTFNYLVKNAIGTVIAGPATLITPKIITGLPVDSTIGYYVKVYDTSIPVNTCITTGLTVNGPTSIILTPQHTNVTCYGGNNGTLNLNITGGQTPYSITTTGPSSYISTSPSMTGLIAGTYISNVVDALGTTTTTTNVITAPSAMVLTLASAVLIGKQCDPTQYVIPFLYTAGATAQQEAGINPLLVEYQIDSGIWNQISLTLNSSNPTTTPLYINVPIGLNTSVKIRYKNSVCTSNVLSVLKSSMELPPAVLTVTPSIITKQCNPGFANLGLTLNYLSRAPYTVNYTINGISQTSFAISTNPTLWVKPVPSSSVTIIYTITDSKGCIATATQIVKTPVVGLSCNVTTSGPVSGNYTHTVTGTGGIGTITGVGVVTNTSSIYTATIIDSVGCTATHTG